MSTPTREETAAHPQSPEPLRGRVHVKTSLYCFTEGSAVLTPHHLARETLAGRFTSSVRGLRRPCAPEDSVDGGYSQFPLGQSCPKPGHQWRSLPAPPWPQTPLPHRQNSERAPHVSDHSQWSEDKRTPISPRLRVCFVAVWHPGEPSGNLFATLPARGPQ